MIIINYILAFTFLVLAFIHFNWVMGSRWGLEAALPTKPGSGPAMLPGKLITAVVGIGLLSISMYYLGRGLSWSFIESNGVFDYVAYIIPGLFFLRSIGEFNYVGLFKKIKGTKFAEFDTKHYIPLCLSISILGFLVASH